VLTAKKIRRKVFLEDKGAAFSQKSLGKRAAVNSLVISVKTKQKGVT
jgi:hypothetical protein